MANEQVTTIRELLQDFATAMLVTHGTDSPFHARPMAIARVESNCDLWFFTGKSSAKVNEIENDQRILVVCQDERSRYVSLRGRANLTLDRGKAEELWKESFKVWFPDGLADPDLLLIRVTAEDAEYWDNQGFKRIQYLFEAAKAYVRNTQPEVEEGTQHGTVSFNE